jgi:hypothetical protein
LLVNKLKHRSRGGLKGNGGVTTGIHPPALACPRTHSALRGGTTRIEVSE